MSSRNEELLQLLIAKKYPLLNKELNKAIFAETYLEFYKKKQAEEKNIIINIETTSILEGNILTISFSDSIITIEDGGFLPLGEMVLKTSDLVITLGEDGSITDITRGFLTCNLKQKSTDGLLSTETTSTNSIIPPEVKRKFLRFKEDPEFTNFGVDAIIDCSNSLRFGFGCYPEKRDLIDSSNRCKFYFTPYNGRELGEISISDNTLFITFPKMSLTSEYSTSGVIVSITYNLQYNNVLVKLP